MAMIGGIRRTIIFGTDPSHRLDSEKLGSHAIRSRGTDLLGRKTKTSGSASSLIIQPCGLLVLPEDHT